MFGIYFKKIKFLKEGFLRMFLLSFSQQQKIHKKGINITFPSNFFNTLKISSYFLLSYLM